MKNVLPPFIEIYRALIATPSMVHTSGANTVISVDRDGVGSAFKSTDLVTLENVQLTLNDLLQN
ncbi:type I secretion C-terminal target domain-containing protein, partial [Salmonella enterica subsp. enterica serovar Muenster]|nr:type I secretion C-terminal target domain-containing protein [Salmonella enterica subsp. enterica serovar Muenster]